MRYCEWPRRSTAEKGDDFASSHDRPEARQGIVLTKTSALEGLSMSALGQKRTPGHVKSMSALPPKADMDQHARDVRFVAKGRHSGCLWILLLVGKGAQVRGASPVKLPRRHFLHLAAGAMPLPTVSRIAMAQTSPSRPVRWIVGFAPGGGYDIVARVMGQWLSEKLGQQFVIENRPGASTNVATEAALRAPPDGYTLFLASPASAINATLYQNLNFNFVRDSTPVAGITSSPILMVVHPTVPAKTVAEFIAYAKANPG